MHIQKEMLGDSRGFCIMFLHLRTSEAHQPESELFCKDLAFLSIPLPLTIMIGAVCSAKTGRPHTKLEFAAHPPWHKNTKAQALETLQFSSMRDCILLTESLGTRTRCDKCLEKPEDGFGLFFRHLYVFIDLRLYESSPLAFQPDIHHGNCVESASWNQTTVWCIQRNPKESKNHDRIISHLS